MKSALARTSCWKCAGYVAGLVELRHSVWRQVDVEAGEVVGELLCAMRAQDWHHAAMGA